MSSARLVARDDLRIDGDVVGVGFDRRLSDDTAFALLRSDLIAHVNEVAAGKDPSLVVIDCRAVESFTSAALGKLVMLQKALSEVKWKLALFGLPARFRELLAVTAADKVFTIVSDEAELRELGRQAAADPPATPAAGSVPADLREWARAHFDEAEFLAGLREVETTGGRTLDEFIGELERRLALRE